MQKETGVRIRSGSSVKRHRQSTRCTLGSPVDRSALLGGSFHRKRGCALLRGLGPRAPTLLQLGSENSALAR